jgi:hypothetical protein
VHKTFVAIIEKLQGSDENGWVYANEWQKYILNPDKYHEDGEVYYRDLLPLRDDPAIATSNPPFLCEAMYFERQKPAGYLIVSVLLVIAGIKFIIAMLWYFVKILLGQV